MSRRCALLLWLAVAGCATSSSGTDDAGPGDGDGDGDGDADAAVGPDAAVRPPCVEGDARVQDPVTGHCYILFNQTRNWDDAVTECASVDDGVHLATIDGDAENAVINNLAGQEVWIGGNDKDVEMTFIWITGESFAYTNWRSGEPNGGDEDCIVYQGQLNGVWDDRPCGNNHPIVCERD